MEASLWFAIVIICGLINTYLFFFFSTKNLFSWLYSLLAWAFTPKPTQKATQKEEAASDSSLDPETLFAIFDRDGDGYITAKELEASFTRLGLAVDSEEVRSEIGKVDTDNDGLIDLKEFHKIYYSVLGLSGDGIRDISITETTEKEDDDEEREQEERELKGAFDIFDKNGDGMISAEELQTILKAFELKKGEKIEDCIDMIRKVDMNGDGMVNFEEFKRMMAYKGWNNDLSKETNVITTC